jgi:hypothetical protein
MIDPLFGVRRRTLRGIAAVALAATCSVAALAQSSDVITKKGALIEAKVTTPISSKTSQSGDPFSLQITDSLFHHHPELKGAVVDGHLENVTPASATHKATLSLIFDDITFGDGGKEPISVVVNKLSQVEPKTHHIRDIGIIVGGAVAGHIVSKKTGHGGGTLAGAAAGFALVSSLKSDIVIKPGTIIQLKLKADIDEPAAST